MFYKNLLTENLDNEIWKDIKEYNGSYQISNYGRIKSLKFKKKKILKQTISNNGYLTINLWNLGKCKLKQIHILLYETFNNCKLKKDECIHHKDENKLNNIPNNLQKMTKSEHLSLHKKGINNPNFGIHRFGKNNPMFGKYHSKNTKKLISKKVSGNNNPRSILKESDIIKIREYLDKSILTQREIGKIFGVSNQTISAIKNNKLWRNTK